jgi:adenine deaminase
MEESGGSLSTVSTITLGRGIVLLRREQKKPKLNLKIGGLQSSDLFAESNDKLHEYRAAMKRIKNTAAMAEGSIAALLEK